jgi:hypothetical protein
VCWHSASASGFIDCQAIKDEGKQLTADVERHVTDAMKAMVDPESSFMKISVRGHGGWSLRVGK